MGNWMIMLVMMVVSLTGFFGAPIHCWKEHTNILWITFLQDLRDVLTCHSKSCFFCRLSHADTSSWTLSGSRYVSYVFICSTDIVWLELACPTLWVHYFEMYLWSSMYINTHLVSKHSTHYVEYNPCSNSPWSGCLFDSRRMTYPAPSWIGPEQRMFFFGTNCNSELFYWLQPFSYVFVQEFLVWGGCPKRVNIW